MRTIILCIALVLGVWSARADDAAKKELASTGKLRAAIAVAPAPGVFFAIKDKSSGEYRGVTVELARALAAKVGVGVEFVVYSNSGQIVAAADRGEWDVTFLPVDEERRKAVVFGNPYCLLQSTYLVAPESSIQSLADIDRTGIRIVGVKNTATMRASAIVSPNASHTAVAGPAESVELMREGKADAIATGREALVAMATRIPGSRILDGAFLITTVAIAVPKDKPAALAFARAFIKDATSSGQVRRLFDDFGLHTSIVAPADMEPVPEIIQRPQSTVKN